MKLKTGRYAGIALVGALALAGCGSSGNNNASSGSSSAPSTGESSAASMAPSSSASAMASASGSGGAAPADVPITCVSASINGAGSSFQDPLQQKWIAQYLAKCSGAQITYTSVGSGAGIQQFGSGTIDFAGSDVTMQAQEQATANQRCGGNPAIHIPIGAGGVGITYNLPGVDSLQLSPDTLAGIFQGSITTWDAPAIKADNPNATLPSTPITVFHRSDASGTNSVFSSYMDAATDKWTLGTGKSLNWPAGQGAKGNEGVSAGVNQTKGGITYTEQAFAQQKNLPLALIKNGGGNYVKLTSDNVSNALQSINIKPISPNDLSAQINFQPKGPNDYPISTVTYVIACDKYPSGMGADKVSLLKNYLSYAVTTGQQYAKDLGFAPLPASLQTKDLASINSIG